MHKVVVAGGDTRDAWLCRFLADQGFSVSTMGFHVLSLPDFDSEGEAPDIFIGPMTGIEFDGRMETMDGVTFFTEDLLRRMPSGSILAAGLVSDPLVRVANDQGIRIIQYRLEDTFMWLNTVPTAEGAIRAAMGRSGYTLFGRPIAVLGFGRVGSILSLRLKAYGAIVDTYDRSPERRAMARAMGFPSYALSQRQRPIDGVFNTVPAPVLDEDWVYGTEPAWIIDLASKPGGLVSSLKKRATMDSRYCQILGLPGMVAPIRAAEIVWETLSLAWE